MGQRSVGNQHLACIYILYTQSPLTSSTTEYLLSGLMCPRMTSYLSAGATLASSMYDNDRRNYPSLLAGISWSNRTLEKPHGLGVVITCVPLRVHLFLFLKHLFAFSKRCQFLCAHALLVPHNPAERARAERSYMYRAKFIISMDTPEISACSADTVETSGLTASDRLD